MSLPGNNSAHPASECYKTNPLQWGGTSRNQRILDALTPGYIPIDERRIQELILFVHDYAELIAYYDSKNTYRGDWQDFFKDDISTHFSKVAALNSSLVRETFFKYYNKLVEPTDDTGQAEIYLVKLFGIAFSLLKDIDRISATILPGSPLKQDLVIEIKGRLRKELKQLIALYKSGVQPVLKADVNFGYGEDDSYSFADLRFVESDGFSSIWICAGNNRNENDNGHDNSISWNEYFQAVSGRENEDKKYLDTNDSNSDIDILIQMARDARPIFDRVYAAYVRIIKNAAQQLAGTLDKYPGHSPHNALVLAFFKLFSFQIEELNQLTESHMQFYFQDVLRLKEKPAVPDSAHVIVQLAKHKKTHLIKAGTLFKAGKDQTGKDLIYRNEREWVINRAQVAELKTLFIDPDKGVYHAQVANSLHGLGLDPLDPLTPYWRPFGQPQNGLPEENRTMTLAEEVFAIASPMLRLNEGKRIISFRFKITHSVYPVLHLATFSSSPFVGSNQQYRRLSNFMIYPILNFDSDALLLCRCLEVSLSGSKEWLTCDTLWTTSLQRSDGNGDASPKEITLKLTLDNDIPPVEDYNNALPGNEFDTSYPVALFRIKKNISKQDYRLLSQFEISEIMIETTVSEFRDLVLYNDFGAMDPGKSFMPFGSRPKIGSAFYIGARELFCKPLTSLRFHVEWLGLPNESFFSYYSYKDNSGKSLLNYYLKVEDNYAFKVKAAFLEKGKWSPDFNSRQELRLFEPMDDYIDSQTLLEMSRSRLPSHDPHLESFDSFDIETKSGFMKLELSSPDGAFGHESYMGAYSRQIIAMTGSGGPRRATLPKEPYTPVIKSIECDYTASSPVSQFFHILPFGRREVTNTDGQLPTGPLLPRFTHITKKGKDENITGALHLGIKDSEPHQILSVLFQMAEGTEDFSKNPPPVTWSFLNGNRWENLEENIVSDSTNSLTGSGIIRFTVPRTTNQQCTVMPGSLLWFRASIAGDYDAIPQLIDIKTQALNVTFTDNQNDPNHLALPLSGETIKKLVDSDSAIKKIIQPYESFNGRIKEPTSQFYNRVSERLRHKNRAITIWDYERIVLEEFPFVYKVKCLNHTNSPGQNDSTEIAPGCVRIVVIPDMHNRKAGNRFQPAVCGNRRSDIKKYLQRLSSDFVDIDVENPLYEAVQIFCIVAFYEGFDPLFYREQLARDFARFLSPWAFDTQRVIEFGGSIHQSAIIKFAENLDYVDFITDVHLKIHIPGVFSEKTSRVKASTSRSILTGHTSHIIGLHGHTTDSEGQEIKVIDI